MIERIATHYPSTVLTNDQLAAIYPDWPAEKIKEKTGISQRHVASEAECASDLAAAVAERILPAENRQADWLLFCTQTPDYLLPTSACLLQRRLGLPTSCAALDFNLGCSGYVYGLAMASALINSGQAARVLLLTGDTYTRLIHPEDKATRTIFGDAGTATLMSGDSSAKPHSFVLGTDGRGESELIVRAGGARLSRESTTNNPREALAGCLYMNGPEVFKFTIKAVPKLVSQVLAKAGLTLDQVDLVVFHQANGYMLEHLRRKLNIPSEKFVLHFAHCGNTVSSSIPIVLEYLLATERLTQGMRVLIAGFGVGFSWGGCIVDW